MFSTNHFIWLTLCAIFIATMSIISVKLRWSFKTATTVVCGISLASELCKIFTHIDQSVDKDGSVTSGVLGPEYLPLHLCSILIFLLFYLLVSKNDARKETVKSFILPIAILGGTLALLIPTSGVNFARPYAYQCFVYHSAILWYGIYLLATRQVSLGVRAYKRTMLLLGCLVIVMLWINSLLSVYETNFFYLTRPPMDNLPVLNLKNGWFAYFFTLIGIGVVAVSAVYLPSIISETRAMKKEK